MSDFVENLLRRPQLRRAGSSRNQCFFCVKVLVNDQTALDMSIQCHVPYKNYNAHYHSRKVVVVGRFLLIMSVVNAWEEESKV